MSSLSDMFRYSSRLRGTTTLAVKSPTAVTVLILAAALGYWLWFGLTQRAIVWDDGISIIAAESILDHGYMEMPSGYVYQRGILPHYVLAGAIRVLGLNEFSIRVPSLVFALGSLWMLHIFGRRLTGGPLVGLAAMVLLLAFQMQTIHATGARTTYMSLQFFTLLAAYSAWRGYVQGDGRFRVITILALAGAFLSHAEGSALPLAIPMAASIALLLARRKSAWLLPLWIVGAVTLMGAISLNWLYSPSSAMPALTAQPGPDVPTVFGLNLNLVAWARTAFDPPHRVLIYVLGFAPFAVFVGVSGFRRKWDVINPASTYILLILTLSGLLLILGTPRTTPRLWLFVLPFLALVVADGAALLVQRFGPRVERWLKVNPVARSAALLLGASVLAALTGLGFYAAGSDKAGLAFKLVGPACQGWDCDKSMKAHYSSVRGQIQPEDLVIASSPFVARWYLGRVDGYLHEKIPTRSRGVGPRADYMEDEYLGIPLIDERDLHDFLEQRRRVWVVTDIKMGWTSGEEVPSFLDSRYERFLSDGIMTTYVHCGRSPCGRSPGIAD